VLNGTLNAGNDFVTLTTLPLTNVTMALNDGNDQIKMTYCSIATLTLDGGTGTNTLTKLTSKVTKPVITNIQVFLPPG
jgi:hypothetical protein